MRLFKRSNLIAQIMASSTYRIDLYINDRVNTWSENKYHYIYHVDVDTVDLGISEYANNNLPMTPINRYILATLQMPDPPTEIPAKASKRIRRIKLFDGACEIVSNFAWLKPDQRWRRDSSTVILNYEIATEGPLAKVRSVVKEIDEVYNLSAEIIDQRKSVKEAVETASNLRKRVIELHEELLQVKRLLSSTEEFIAESELSSSSLQAKLSEANVRLHTSVLN